MNNFWPVFRSRALLAAMALSGILAARTGFATEKLAFRLKGTYVEGCSCGIPCACELLGVTKGCEGVGAMRLTGGKFHGVDLAGAKFAYAVAPGRWMRLYADAPKPAQRDALLAFARAYYADWGKIESARAASIVLEGKAGSYTLKVDDGKVLELKTEPVLGGDGSSPVRISNTKSKLNPTFLQGRTLSGHFHDGDRAFELENSNSYFNELNCRGEL